MKPQPIQPEPGQESVWDYPRPPKLEQVSQRIQVVYNGQTIADTQQAYRVLETSHPPVYYLPPADVQMPYLRITDGNSFCEWKGKALYYHLAVGSQSVKNAAWAYAEPTGNFKPIAGYLAFYAHLMDACYVDGERVTPQPGGFYGGWVTKNIVGPFKGVAGSWGW
jgi:uncharacterized protein (DUF427 family)